MRSGNKPNGRETPQVVLFISRLISYYSGFSRYILCVKSNNERHPARFDLPTVSRQLKWLCVNDLLLFRLRGYPIRIPFTIFTQRYRCLLLSDVAMHQKQKEIIVDILEGQGEDFGMDYKIGRSQEEGPIPSFRKELCLLT